jgi:hypothetical protein
MPWWLIALWLLAMLAIITWSYRQFSDKISRTYRLGMLACGLVALLAALLLLMQPMQVQRTPETGSFRCVVLADQSLSMETRDGGDAQARSNALSELLAARPPALNTLAGQGRLEYYGFAEDSHALAFANGRPLLETLPGRTALGSNLHQLLSDAEKGLALGAVVLLSDGRNNSGEAPMEVAKRYRAKGIPISCVGFGSARAPWDLSISTRQDSLRVQRDQSFTVDATVTNHFPEPKTVVITAADRGMVMAEKTIEVPANASVDTALTLSASNAGFHTYALRLQPTPGDSRPDNDVDFIGVDVQEPPTLRVLYLGGGLDWEWRFLRQLAENNEQLRFSAIIQLGPGSFYHSGLSDEQCKESLAFPDKTTFYRDFHAVILDARAAPAISADGIKALESFVANKGGGLLLRGPLDLLPPTLAAIIPQHLPGGRVVVPALRLEPNPDFIFNRDFAGILRTGRGLWLPHNTPLWVAGELKRAARVALALPYASQSMPALAAQGYGAGRAATMAVESTWRWRLGDNSRDELHQVFWTHLLTWLGEVGKAQVRMHCRGVKAPLGDELAIDISVLGADFLPAPDAQLNARITAPDGSERQIPMEPAPDEVGRYTALYIPTQPGEHQVLYEVRLPEQPLLESGTSFVARQSGIEAEDSSFNEALLRDIARVSGGDFFTPEEFRRARRVPLATSIPMRTTTRPLASSWLLFAVLSGALLLLWWSRRRIGLK